MNNEDKDSHIARLENEVRQLEEKAAAMQIQLSAVYDLFMLPDPMGDGTTTRARRIMDVVNAWESGTWAIKWGVRIILTIGATVVALKGLGISWSIR